MQMFLIIHTCMLHKSKMMHFDKKKTEVAYIALNDFYDDIHWMFDIIIQLQEELVNLQIQ